MRRMLVLGLVLTVGACAANATDPRPPSISGSYELTIVDGQSLPVTLLDLGAYRLQVVSGTLTMDPGGTYAQELGLRIEDSGNVRTSTDSDAGRWTVVGDSITLVSDGGGFSRTGTVVGDAITLQSSAWVFRLRK